MRCLLCVILAFSVLGCAGVQRDYVAADRRNKEALEAHLSARRTQLSPADAQSLKDLEDTWEQRLQAAEKANKLEWDDAAQSYKE